jgi:glycosyltransferase involved in cell wall biosynthesis
VVFAGGGDEALATHYRHAALLVCPSLYEGFGLPPLEAMRYGCPAAVANTPALRETLGDAGVFFDPRRPEQIADCMLELLASEQRRKALAEAGRNRLEQFTLERCVTETARFYREVAS